MAETTELWNNFYLIGTAGQGAGTGVLVCTPGKASDAIPKSLEYARLFARSHIQAVIYGIYVGDSGIGEHSSTCGWHHLAGTVLWPDRFYLDFSGGRFTRPLVSQFVQAKRKGWPARIQRVAGPADQRLDTRQEAEGRWVMAQEVWWPGRPGHPGKRYQRAAKSMQEIKSALDRDGTFLEAFRHGA